MPKSEKPRHANNHEVPQSDSAPIAKLQARNKAEFAKQIFDHLIAEGLTENDAWERSLRLMSPKQRGRPRNNTAIATRQHSGYDTAKGDMMIAAAKPSKRNGSSKQKRIRAGELQYTNFPLPIGDGLVAILCRGLARWREHKKLFISQASPKYNFDRRLWYKVEQGMGGRNFIPNLDALCKAIGVHHEELMRLGRPPLKT